MGAYDFTSTATGKNPGDAFSAAREQALYDYGHAGYTGTIAEKYEYVFIDDSWKDLKARFVRELKEAQAAVKAAVGGSGNESSREYHKRAYESKDVYLKRLRFKVNELRALRDKCKARMSGYEKADILMEVSDDRINDKWGPAGCIEVAKVKGRRGVREYIFFGWASS